MMRMTGRFELRLSSLEAFVGDKVVVSEEVCDMSRRRPVSKMTCTLIRTLNQRS